MKSPYPSTLLENAVNEFAKLPGIGRKSALRLVLHMLRQDEEAVTRFSDTLLRLKREVNYCSCCHNISDTKVCSICADPSRDTTTLCVVGEREGGDGYRANGNSSGDSITCWAAIVSPIDGIGPSDLEIASLEERVKAGGIQEVILALSATMEGDTTNFYIYP